MKTVTFTGEEKQINNIIKENRVRVSRGVEMTVDGGKSEESESQPEEPKKRVRRTKEQIEADSKN